MSSTELQKWSVALLAVLCIIFGPAVGAAPQQPLTPAMPPDVQKLGPQVGTRGPDFSLPDQHGQTRTLQPLMGPKGLMLVFYQSADWCPYYKTQLAELQTRTADLMKNGVGIAAVSYDPAGSMLARLGNNMAVPAMTVSSPQVEIASFATDSTVAAGAHFSLVLDLRLAAGVHVYAPGVTGYKPIGLSIQPQPGVIIRDAQYPASEDYHFKPLNEHIPAFQRPFRIAQDVAIDASVQGQTVLRDMAVLTIKGGLNYQGCDDKLCFTPQSAPIKWTVTLRQLDRERAKP